jgi:hypothetical protein
VYNVNGTEQKNKEAYSTEKQQILSGRSMPKLVANANFQFSRFKNKL